MRLNNSIERYVDQIDCSRLQIQCIGATAWLAGAGVSGAWMMHGGGVAKPLVTFAVWATGVCFIMVRTLAGSSGAAPTKSEVVQALRYGGYSVVGLALGTLFCEYWPITVSMAFMFAICRSFEESEDTAAYV